MIKLINILLKRYQEKGHHPIALIGGATGMIGDPRPTTERQLLNDADLKKNFDGLSEQISRILQSENKTTNLVIARKNPCITRLLFANPFKMGPRSRGS